MSDDDDDAIRHEKRGQFFNRQGQEITMAEWVWLGQDIGYIHVAFDCVDGVDVSTRLDLRDDGVRRTPRPGPTPLLHRSWGQDRTRRDRRRCPFSGHRHGTP